jgi:thioredoxin-related protein
MLLSSISAIAQDTTIQWQSFSQTRTLLKKKIKPILIFAYSKNDTLSKKMYKTFDIPEVANYINALFYPIRIDVRTKDTITFFNGEKFVHIKGKKYHDLVEKLFVDSVSTPAIIMFGKNAQGRVFYGFKNRDSIFPILIYYAEDVYLTTKYKDWEKIYFKAYPPGVRQVITHLNIHWLQMNEMLEKRQKQKKKIFIDIYNNYNVAQTVMRLRVYNNPRIAHYLNSKFYPVSLLLTSKEEFEIKGVKYKNTGNPLNYNQFAIAVLNGKMRFPAFVILDENLNLLDRIQVFMTDKELEPILHYFGDDKYKTMTYKAFLQEWKKRQKK